MKHGTEQEPILREDIESKVGSNVIIKFPHIHGGVGVRKGILSIDKGWCYLYDSGKVGNNYNCAFPLIPKKAYEKILSIERI